MLTFKFSLFISSVGFIYEVCNGLRSMNMTVDTTINERDHFRTKTNTYLYMHRVYATCFDLYVGHHQAFLYEL
jgi:hypothetical protein